MFVNKIKTFINDENGATAVEYGLIAALIAIGLVAGATALGDQLNGSFDNTAGELDAAVTSANSNTASNGN